MFKIRTSIFLTATSSVFLFGQSEVAAAFQQQTKVNAGSLQLAQVQSTAKYDALYECEMAKARENYMQRKKMDGLVDTGATWEELQKMAF